MTIRDDLRFYFRTFHNSPNNWCWRGEITPKAYMKTHVSWHFIIKVLITNTNSDVLPLKQCLNNNILPNRGLSINGCGKPLSSR